MARQKVTERDNAKAAKGAGKRGAAEVAGGQHHAAKAHGQASKVDASLPSTREALITLHAEARGRRNAAPLDSPAFRAAVIDLERIEVRIAAIERAQDPPLG